MMWQWFQEWHKKRRERRALTKIIGCMETDMHLIIEDLARQVEQKLAAMSPEDRQQAIKLLKEK